jgi:hypothetical protein
VILPGATFIDLGPDGGPYDETAHPKICWHTTEGNSLAGAEAAFRPFPPHLGYDPRSRTLHQYVRLDRHSFALRGDESDDEFVIQIEVVGHAAETPGWPTEWYRNIGVDLIRPLRDLLGVPDQHLRFHGPNEGIVLAKATSPIRLTDAAFRGFSGHLGHQHAPAPDVHWDPGGFRIAEAITFSHEEDDMPTAREVAIAVLDVDLGGGWSLADAARALATGQEGVRPGGFYVNLLAEILAAAHEDIDAKTVVARLDEGVRDATKQAVEASVLPALVRVEQALAEEDAEGAKAIVTELAERLRAVA